MPRASTSKAAPKPGKSRKRSSKPKAARTPKPKSSPAPTADAKPKGLVATLKRRPLLFLSLVVALIAWVVAVDLETLDPSPVAGSLISGDWVLVDRATPELLPGVHTPFVLVRDPFDRQHELLARTLAWEGQHITTHANTLSVDTLALTLPAPLASRGLDLAPRPGRDVPGFLKARPLSRLQALGLPKPVVTVPRDHVWVLLPSEHNGAQVRAFMLPQGDVIGVPRRVLTNTETEAGWQSRLLRPIQ